jgi:hypothetical protein
MFPCAKDGNRISGVSKIPALQWRVPPCSEFVTGEDTNLKDGQHKVSGEDSEERTNLR